MKKLLLTLALCALMCALFVIGASAATTVTDDGSNVTLGNCTIANSGVTIPSPTRGLAYSLDDETGTATVTGKGSFAGGEGTSLVIPSSVTYNGKTYAVETISAGVFKNMTFNLYIPDSLVTIAGGGSNGAFGTCNIDKAYLGCGIKTFGQETFSTAKGFSVFFCQAKPEQIGKHAFNSMTVSTADIIGIDFSEVKRVEQYGFNSCPFRMNLNFTDNLEYLGSEAFRYAGVIYAYIPAGAEVNYGGFNNCATLQLMIFDVAPGTTKVFPQEFLSNAGANNCKLVVTGNITFGGQAPFSGKKNVGHKLYLPTIASLETMLENYVETVDNYTDRIEEMEVYVCETGKTYKAYRGGTYSETGTAAENHAYSEFVHYDANCTYFERNEKYCYACGNKVINNLGTTLGDHIFETSVKLPTCQSIGYTEFDCTVCALQETGAYVEKSAHNNTLEKYGAVTGSNLEVSYYCADCKTFDRTESVSLVNKCYIEGYGLFDASKSLKYLIISAAGVVTPSSEAFDRENIYFPSFVMIGEDIVEVKTIQGFNGKSIRAIYVPDTVTRIVGGSNIGCFGNNPNLLNVVVGKGVTKVEREVFSNGTNPVLKEFIWKGTITEIHTFAFNHVSAESNTIPYEFNTRLTYVGKQVNLEGTLIREAYIAKGCDLSEKFAFNNANGLLTVYIEGGDTEAEALDLGQEFTSNKCTKYYYIKGYVKTSGWAVLSGQSGTVVYMDNTDTVDAFVKTIVGRGNERLSTTVFYTCKEGKTWRFTSNSDANSRVEHNVAFAHGTVTETSDATCAQAGTQIEKCFVCGTVVSTTESAKLEHVFDGGVITVMPNCKDLGVIVYKCTNSGCKESKTISIFRDYSSHEYSYFIAYVNGFDKAGAEGERCAICKDTRNDVVLGAIITPIGYSVRNNRTGIDGGYQIDKALLEKYETQNGNIRLGIIITNATLASKLGLVDEDFELISDKGLQVELVQRGYTTFSLYITGFNTDTLRALDLLITSYVVADLDGDGETEISYCQYEMPDKDNEPTSFDGKLLNTVSIDRADPVAVVPASYKPEEQN